MDRRQQKNKNAIILAFEELISKNAATKSQFSRLSTRRTWGARLSTRILKPRKACSTLFAGICSRTFFDEDFKEENTHDFSKSERSETEMLTHILYHLKDDKSRYKKLFAGQSADFFWERFRILFKEKLAEESKKGKWKAKSNIPEDLYIELYTSSFVETVKCWFTVSAGKTPEEVVEFFNSVF